MRRLLLLAVLALNVLALLAMAVDKLRAVRGGRRVPERSLLLLAAPLAAPGTWLGMWAFSHKIRKRPFRAALVLVTILNVVLAAGLWRLLRGHF